MSDKIVTVTLEEDYRAVAQSRHHEWYADLDEAKGGADSAPSPEELVMGTLGACMTQTAKLYAVRKGWQVDRIIVRLSYERINANDYEAYDGDSAFIHEIREHIEVEGPLDPRQKARVIEIMGKCPIRRLIQSPAFFVDAEPETGD